MSHLTDQQLSHLERTLLQEKIDLERRFEATEHFGLLSSLGDWELSSYDNHPADIGTEMYERGKDIALNEHAKFEHEQIEQALAAIEKGSYGSCIVCGTEIPYERLEIIPTTMYCKAHVPDPNVSNRRPVEEELLQPPFGRTSLDELPEQNQFDGEDAWQIVESWGNSDSPAMAEDPDIASYNDLYIESDENEGFVEPLESFLATDIYGNQVTVVRNKQYRDYMASGEGDPLLEPDSVYESEDGGYDTSY
jgi:YteA family regulatory protein